MSYSVNKKWFSSFVFSCVFPSLLSSIEFPHQAPFGVLLGLITTVTPVMLTGPGSVPTGLCLPFSLVVPVLCCKAWASKSLAQRCCGIDPGQSQPWLPPGSERHQAAAPVLFISLLRCPPINTLLLFSIQCLISAPFSSLIYLVWTSSATLTWLINPARVHHFSAGLAEPLHSSRNRRRISRWWRVSVWPLPLSQVFLFKVLHTFPWWSSPVFSKLQLCVEWWVIWCERLMSHDD